MRTEKKMEGVVRAPGKKLKRWSRLTNSKKMTSNKKQETR
jgi:hypothetical protein